MAPVHHHRTRLVSAGHADLRPATWRPLDAAKDVRCAGRRRRALDGGGALSSLAACSPGATTTSTTKSTTSSPPRRSTSRPPTAPPSPPPSSPRCASTAGSSSPPAPRPRCTRITSSPTTFTKIGGGKTYAQLSAESIAQPNNAALTAQVNEMFKGETLRGLLLNTYTFGTIGTIAGIAALAAFVGRRRCCSCSSGPRPVSRPPSVPDRRDPRQRPRTPTGHRRRLSRSYTTPVRGRLGSARCATCDPNLPQERSCSGTALRRCRAVRDT